MGLPPCCTELRCTSRARVAASSAEAASPSSCVNRVYPVMSRKQIAGGRSRRLWIPALAITCSNPSMMFAVHSRACCAWYMESIACSDSGVIWSAKSGLPMSSALFPAVIAGWITSDRHQAASCSLIRRVASPVTRSSRSIAGVRNPAAICISRNGKTPSSSSRIRSSGEGWAIPIDSRMTMSSSSGTPVRSLTWRNVSLHRPANRSYAALSRKFRFRSPAFIAAPNTSKGMPAPSSDLAVSARRTSPSEKPSRSPGTMPSSRSRER